MEAVVAAGDPALGGLTNGSVGAGASTFRMEMPQCGPIFIFICCLILSRRTMVRCRCSACS